MHVGVIAGRGVEAGFLEATAESAVRLSDALGFDELPEFSLQEIDDEQLTTNRRGQVDCTVIDNLPAFVNGGLTVVVTSRDLGVGDDYPRPLNFLYGISHKGRGNLLMSTHRMRTTGDFAALTLHESGHSFGLVEAGQPNYDRISSFAGHCVNPCVMQPGNDYADLQKMVRQNQSRDPFCGDCSGFLGRVLRPA